MEDTYKIHYAPPLHWYKKWWGLLIIGFLTLLAIFITASGFYIYDEVQKIKMQNGFNPKSENKIIYSNLEVPGSYSFGSKNAGVTIVEFADFSCPNCLNFDKKMRKIRAKYYNDLRLVYRDFPVIADFSENLALAARCAGEQDNGYFWMMHDKLFENQGSVQTNEAIYSLAKLIGLDQNQFDLCFRNQKYSSQIAKDLADGFKLKIEGTPTWFINGLRVDGDISDDLFFKLIDKYISENKKNTAN